MTARLLALALLGLASISASAQAPAFPGAEGHGRYTTGGRGGKVVHVTNLNDSGTGSFRSAVSASNRIVVFDVAGVIALKSAINMKSNITIEGQTAPAPGITLRYYTICPGTNNIIRFVRFRRGNEKDKNDGADCMWQRHITGLILDHCSFSWSIDELASFYDNNNMTMQWCMLGEALANAGHNKGSHSYGGIWGGKLASFHHNYLGFMENRVPRFNGARYNWTGYTGNKLYSDYKWKNAVQAENVDLRNCVMYNWGGGGCYGGPGGGYVNIVNNYYKGGPGTAHPDRVTQVTVSASGNSGSDTIYHDMTSRYFISGNYVASQSKAENYDWKGVVYDPGVFTIDGETYSYDNHHYYGDTVEYKKNSAGNDCVRIRLDAPAPTGYVTTHSAEEAYDKVLLYSGASLHRDTIDAAFAYQTREGTTFYIGSNGSSHKGIIDNTADDKAAYNETTEGWGLTRSALTDTDNDGMPDDWERANGLDPNDAGDAAKYTLDDALNGGRGWYTNIEVYCNSLVEDIMKAENADAEETVDEYYPTCSSTTGISAPRSGKNEARQQMYNLSGQRVGEQYKGFVISNGRVVVRR